MINFFLIIFEQVCIHLPLIFGAYISFSLMKVPDLSIESAYVFGAMLGSLVIISIPPLSSPVLLFVALSVSIIGGLLVGLISSSITEKGGIPHLLSSILTIGIFHGVVQLITQPYISLAGHTNSLIFTQAVPTHPEIIALFCIATILTLVFAGLFYTQLGYCFAIFGNNRSFFEHYRISKTYVFMVGICMSNACAGLSGYLFAQTSGFAEMGMGFAKPLLCITSLILGKYLFRLSGRLLTILVPILGTISYFLLQQVLLKVGFNLKYFTAVQSLIVLTLLAITFKNKKKSIDHLGI